MPSTAEDAQSPPEPWRAGSFGAALLALSLLTPACGKSGGLADIASEINPGVDTVDPPEELRYPERIYVMRVGEELEVQLPTFTGEASQFSLNGSLPAGLSFDPATGAIFGTPSELGAFQDVRISAINEGGSDEISLGFSVPQISNYAFGINAGTGSLVSFSLDRSCGSLMPVDSVIAGSLDLSAPQVDPTGQIACLVDRFQLHSFTLDDQSGNVSEADVVDLGLGPHDFFLHPSGDFVYVMTELEDRLRAFAIDSSTGIIDPTPISDLPTGNVPTRLIGDPMGRYLMVEHEFDQASDATPIVSFSIDSASGQITQSATANLTSVDPIQVAVDAFGESLYLTTTTPPEFANWVIHYAIDTETGRPVLADLEKAGQDPTAIGISPRGKYVYVANQGSGDITLMFVQNAGGSLSKINTLDGSNGADAFGFSADGKTLYVVDPEAQSITLHSLKESNGRFETTEVVRTSASSGGLEVLATGGASSLRISDFFVLLQDGGLESFALDTETGELAPALLGPVLGETASGFAVDPLGRFVFASIQGAAAGTSNQIVAHEILCDGSLEATGTPEELLAGLPGLMAIEPTGTYLMVAVGQFDLLLVYEIQSNASLEVVGSRPLEGELIAIEVAPTGAFVSLAYAAVDEDNPARIVTHNLDPETGSLDEGVSTTFDLRPSSMEFTPSATRVYVTLTDEDPGTIDEVRVFDVQVDGSLLQVGGNAISQPEPNDLCLTPDGRFAFVTFEASNAQGTGGGLLVYHVDETTGELTNGSGLPQWRDAPPSGLTNPVGLELSPDGSKLYVLARGTEALYVFDVDAETGFATFTGEAEPVGLGPLFFGGRRVSD